MTLAAVGGTETLLLHVRFSIKTPMEGLGSQLCDHLVEKVCSYVGDLKRVTEERDIYRDVYIGSNPSTDECPTCDLPYTNLLSNETYCTYKRCCNMVFCGRIDCGTDKIKRTCVDCKIVACVYHIICCAKCNADSRYHCKRHGRICNVCNLVSCLSHLCEHNK